MDYETLYYSYNEAINKASQLKPDLQNILALEMMEAITKAQADLKIKKAA
jgi:hypothetical protein